jgi:hypothetical protein
MQTLSIVLIKDSSDSYTIQRINVQNYVLALNLNPKLEKTIGEIDEMLNRKFDMVNVSFHGIEHNPSIVSLFDRFKKKDTVDDDETDEIIFELQAPPRVKNVIFEEIVDLTVPAQPQLSDTAKKIFQGGRHNITRAVELVQGGAPQAPQILVPQNSVKEDAITIIKAMNHNGSYPDFMSKKPKTIQACLNFIMTILDKRHQIVYAEQVRVELLKYLK